MRFFLTSTTVTAATLAAWLCIGVPAHAAKADAEECHLHLGHDLDVLEEEAPSPDGQVHTKVVSRIPDGSTFQCSRDNKTAEGFIKLKSSHGHERFVPLTFSENEGSQESGGDFDAIAKGTAERDVPPKLIVPPTDDKPYTLKKRQIYLDSVDQRIQIFDEPGKSWRKPTDEDKRLFVDVEDGVASNHLTNEPVAFVVEDTKLVQNFEDPRGDVGSKLFYKVAEVPAGKVSDFLRGKKVDGVNYGWINSDNVRDDQLKPEAVTPGCQCTTDEPPKSVNNQLGPMDLGVSGVMKAFEDHVASEAPSCPAHKKEVLTAKPERADGQKISSENSKNTLHRFLDKLSNFFRGKKLDPKPTLAQRKAIDALARTMLGEAGDCDSRYAMAIARVAYNRAQALQTNPQRKHALISDDVATEDFKSKQNGLSHSIIEVLSEAAQFQAWDSDKPTSANLMCVGEDKLSQRIFRRDYKIATEVIMNTENFTKETASLSGVLNYAMGSAKPAPRCERIRHPMKVHGLPVDNYRCFVPYDC